MSQHFDVIVIGSQTSGIIAGALLAKRGCRVLLIDQNEWVTDHQQFGYVLPLKSQLLPNLDHTPAFSAVHKELAMGPALRAATRAVACAYQVVMPQHRFDVGTQFLSELKAEFPELQNLLPSLIKGWQQADEALSAFLQMSPPLPARGWFERLRARSLFAQVAPYAEPFARHALFASLPHDHPLLDLAKNIAVFFGNSWNSVTSTFQAIRLLMRFAHGGVVFADPRHNLSQLLLKTAIESGAEVSAHTSVDTFEISRKRLSMLHLGDDHKSYSANFFIDNTIAGIPQLPTKPVLVKQTGFLLNVHVVVHKRAIPAGMDRAVLLISNRQDPPLLLTREKSIVAATHVEDPTHETLSISCPLRTDSASPDFIAAFTEQILKRLMQVMPFVEDHIMGTSASLETTAWDDPPMLPQTQLRLLATHTHPLYEPIKPALLGIAAQPTTTQYKNLLHTGKDVVLGLGLEGEYITGMMVADWITKKRS
jgi:phytoene dehydrogenase-like protein